MTIRILHIEDDEVVQMAIKRMINAKRLPYDIESASTISKALELLGKDSYDIALIDNKLPDGTGLDLLEKTKERNIPSIFVTGSGDAAVAVKALKGGAYDYLIKDVQNEYLGLLPATIEKVMRTFYLEQEHKKDMEQLAVMHSELSMMYEETKALSLKDPLTGLANRRMMEIDLEKSLARARRSGSPLSILMMDIDYFKKYNDTHGHPAGDRLLAEVAKILSAEVREGDIVARYGGEEFLAVLPDAGIDSASAVAERICKTVRESTTATVSIGAAAYHKGIQKFSELVDMADAALYRAKENGRNRVEVSRT